MQIIAVDNHLLVVHKPAGIPTQLSPQSDVNMTDRSKQWIKHTYHKPGNVFLEPIHRLDKPVSGLVVFARTSKALSRLQQMMRERTIRKWYYAWVEHPLPALEGVLEDYLVHDEYRARIVSSSHREAKKAELSYKVMGSNAGGTLLEIELKTGRYHQIRAQLSHAGSPIIGDNKYNSRKEWSSEGIALHHGRLMLTHPVTHEELTFFSSCPYFSV